MSLGLQARCWNAEEFAASRVAWQGLLLLAEADPLFMSWDWQHRWWVHHREAVGAELRTLALYAGGELVGIAPFYAHGVRHRGLQIRRMELLGAAWRDEAAAFSEYLDIIARRGYESAVLGCVADWLAAETHWHDLVLPYVKHGSLARRLAREHLHGIAAVREVDPVISYGISFPGHFADYARQLKSDVRRKLLHQRGKLGPTNIVPVGESEVANTLAELRELGARRWDATSERLQRFTVDFATWQAQAGGLRLTRLMRAGSTLSIQYDVRVGNTEYYLQSAFDPAASRGLSLGYQHIGYALESACGEGVERFDLLAGRGRHRDYKRDLAQESSTLVCCHVIRPRWLRALYHAYARLRPSSWLGGRQNAIMTGERSGAPGSAPGPALPDGTHFT